MSLRPHTIDCGVVGQMVAGAADRFEPRDPVTGRPGWREVAVAAPDRLPAAGDAFPEPPWPTAPGSPGLTASCPMTLFGQPMPGRLPAAASAGKAAGRYSMQIGTRDGMRNAGVAGDPDKRSIVTKRLGAKHCIKHADPPFPALPRDAALGGIQLFFGTAGGPGADTVFERPGDDAKVPVASRALSKNSERPDFDPVNIRRPWAHQANTACFARYSCPKRRELARERTTAPGRAGRIPSTDNVGAGFENTPSAPRDTLRDLQSGKTLVRHAHAEAGR